MPGLDVAGPALTWIGDERIAISGVPTARTVPRLTEQGVTHVVNCRAQVRWSWELAAERAAFGPWRVATKGPVDGAAVLDALPFR